MSGWEYGSSVRNLAETEERRLRAGRLRDLDRHASWREIAAACGGLEGQYHD